MKKQLGELTQGVCYGILAALLGITPVLVVAWLLAPTRPPVPTQPDVSWEARSDPLPTPKFTNRVPSQGPCQ